MWSGQIERVKHENSIYRQCSSETTNRLGIMVLPRHSLSETSNPYFDRHSTPQAFLVNNNQVIDKTLTDILVKNAIKVG